MPNFTISIDGPEPDKKRRDFKTVTVKISATDYHWAIDAYRAKKGQSEDFRTVVTKVIEAHLNEIENEITSLLEKPKPKPKAVKKDKEKSVKAKTENTNLFNFEGDASE